MMQTLEPRCLHAVTVTTTGNFVSIIGDGTNDSVTVGADAVNGDPTGDSVLGGSDITVDGVKGAVSFLDKPALSSKPWRVNLGSGSDDFSVKSLSSVPVVSVSMGAGNDYFYLGGTATALSVDMGDGDDAAGVGGSNGGDGIYVGNFSFFGGLGRDRLTLSGATGNGQALVGGKLQVVDNSGPFRFNMDLTRVAKEVSIATGNSLDRLSFARSSFGRSLIVSTRGGNDVLIGTNNTFRGEIIIAPGSGNNQVTGLTDEE